MKRLRIRLTLFNAAVTGAVLIVLTILCLVISERNMKDNAFQNLVNHQTRAINALYQEDQVRLSWLREFENTDGTTLCIWDQGRPLFSENLNGEQADFEHARKEARERSINPGEPIQFTVKGQENYYAGYSRIPKQQGELEVVLLYPLAALEGKITRERWIVWTGVVSALGFLILFSWCFTGRMLKPIEENQRKQAEFVAAASHELRTPLAGILSAAEAMEKGSPEDRRRFFGMIRQEGQRMARLIGDMLSLASGDSGKWDIVFMRTEPDMLLLSVYEIFASRVKEKGLNLCISLPEETVPEVSLDSERMEQVLGILIENAMSYTPAPGTIALSLSVEKNSVCFAVSDSGPGIPDEDKKKVFDRFYRKEKERSDHAHFGLGLSIAFEIVNRMGGRLWVEDASLGGAAFYMEFNAEKRLS